MQFYSTLVMRDDMDEILATSANGFVEFPVTIELLFLLRPPRLRLPFFNPDLCGRLPRLSEFPSKVVSDVVLPISAN